MKRKGPEYERARARKRDRQTERECAGNGSKDRSTGESGRHEGFDDSGHAKAETSERVLVIPPRGEKKLRFFRHERKGREREEREIANKPGRK